jgi:transcriptional regulator with XRE-family HTH domain
MEQSLPQILKRLRKQQGGISQRQLAKQSGLSTSIISKIEQDKASPVIRSSTLEMIANGLDLSTDSPDRRLLFEVAWEREQRKRVTTSDLAQLLGAIKASFPDETSKEGGVLVSADDLQKYSQPQVLTRMEEVADCTIWMLEEASKLKLDKVGAEEILVVTQGGSLFRHLGQYDRWSRAIRSAMQRNWNVVSLDRLTGDMERSFEAVLGIRNLSVYPEQYIARYFRRIGELRPPYNLFIVPHIGARLSLSTHNPAVVDTAFFYPASHPDSAPYISSLIDHFNLLFAETVQLARTYKPRSSEWEDTMTATCQREADEFIANNCINSTTMPPALYDELLEQSLRLEKVYSAMAFRRLKTHHIQRREAFERNVRSFKYLTIMPRRSFEIALGLSKEDNRCRYPMELASNPRQYITVDKRQVFEHIVYLIKDLRRYDNFEIALIEDDHPYLKYLQHTPWLVKGEAVVLTATFTETGVIASELELSEASIVRSYRQEFLTIWNEVADQDKAKQKENVIGELMKLLDDAGYKALTSRS